MPVIRPQQHPNATLAKSFRQPLIVGSNGLPRYWATIYIDILAGQLKASTQARKASSIDSFYQYVSNTTGDSLNLDIAISDGRIPEIRKLLTGFLTHLSNCTAVDGVDRGRKWREVNVFLQQVLRHLIHVNSTNLAELQSELSSLKYMMESFRPSKTSRVKPVRALKSAVVSELYDIFSPGTPKNPFRNNALQLRNFLIFYTFLHLGLRKSELLALTINDLNYERSSECGGLRFWLNISGNQHQDIDPRADLPDLKNLSSDRQLPLPDKIFNLISHYIDTVRGPALHPFIFSSQKGKPLSKQSVDDIFSRASKLLSCDAKKLLSSQGLRQVKPHALRHTAVVHRLSVFHATGLEQDLAFQKVRRFFGWAPGSKMPIHYGEAYFESRLHDVWQEDLDSYLDALKAVEL